MRKLALILALLVCAVWLIGAMRSLSHAVYFSVGQAAALGMLGSVTTVNKFGHNKDSDTTRDSVSDVSDFGGPIRCFTVPGTAAALYLSSDDENDAGGSITVQYVNADRVAKELDVTLGVASASGTVFVQIGSETIYWINRMFPTGPAMAGNIYAGIDSADDGTDGIPDTLLTDLVAVIDLLEQQTMSACYSLPAGFMGILHQLCVGTIEDLVNADATFRLQRSVDGGAFRTVKPSHLAEGITQCQDHALPIHFTEKTDIEVNNESSLNGSAVTATFDILLVPNSL